MKPHTKHLFFYILFVSFLFVCFLMASCVIAFVFSNKITFQQAFGQALSSILGIAIFMVVSFLHSVIYHRIAYRQKESPASSYHIFINEIEEAFDRISKGDFAIRIDKEKYDKAGYGNEHFSELVDKINNMAQELSEIETMRQDFVSNVSHEIQSPLTSIRGFVSLLKDESLSNAERLHYIEIIESESQRLSKLGENLLRLSTLDSETTELKPKTYCVSRQLKDVILLLEPQWSRKEIEISLDEGMINIFADEDLLSQVWINLLNNSIKFTPEKGKIVVSITADDAHVQIAISDSGIGMAEETMVHIFERFYMADKARSRSAGGSGLGLSIVKRIVQMHHGNVDVESKLGEGTNFKVFLPKKQSV